MIKTKRIITLLLAFTLVITGMFAFSTERAEAKSPSKYTWSEKSAPNYVVKVGKAKVSKKPKKGKIKYSKLDKKGRTKRVVGNITYRMVERSRGWREEFKPGSEPSGWGRNEIVQIELPNGKYYRGYLWNRSHLIADSLGGRAIRKNLITGTRMQNVGANDGLGGMAYGERKVVSYLYQHHKASVYYSATPVYKGKELIPRSVIVDIRSSDKKINERLIVYNAAKGFRINYKNGTATRTSPAPAAAPLAASAGTLISSPSTAETVYITATGTKYHLDKGCKGLSNANAIYESTREEAVKAGLTPCSICAQ